MPLWAEEHLTTAAVLKSLDLRSKKVLEIGCGAGAFSLLCAREGAAVVAVDCSSRALATTISNANFNKIPWCFAGEKVLKDGQVHVLHQYVESEESILILDGLTEGNGFDIVTITPPYNPSFEFVSPALHASAGRDGQAAFKGMIGPAVRLLSERGYLVCNHMSVVGTRGEVFAEGKIKNEFRNRFGNISVECLTNHCLPQGRYATSRFLKEQYARVRAHLEWADLDIAGNLRAYEKEISNRWPRFELATYLAFLTDHASSPTVNMNSVHEQVVADKRGWIDRTRLHSQIIETATPAGMVQLPFASSRSPAFGRGVPERFAIGTNVHDGDQGVRGRAHDRAGIDLAAHELALGGERVSFDVIVIDAAPLADQVGGKARLSNEITVWLSDKLRKSLDVDEEEFAQLIASRWQANTKFQQEKRTGPFLHPWFTGAFSEGEWTIAQNSIRLDPDGGGTRDSTIGPTDHFARWNEYVGEPNLREDENVKRVEYGDGIALHESEYEDLKVTDPATFLADVLQSERVEFLWKEICSELNLSDEHQSLLSKTRQRIRANQSNGINSLFQAIAPNGAEESVLLTKLLRRDVRNCHFRMHRSLEDLVQPLLPQEMKIGWSSLTGLPLRIRDRASIRASGLPVKYRGGVWVYAVSLDDLPLNQHLEFDELSASISNAVWLNYLDTYGLRSAAQLAEDHLFEFSHQVNEALGLMVHLTRAPSVRQEFLRAQASLVQILFEMHETDISADRIPHYEDFSIEMISEAAWLAGALRLKRGLKDADNELGRRYNELRAKCRNDDMLTAEKLRGLIDIKIDLGDPDTLAIIQEARGAVLIFSGLRQAYYHAFYDQLDGNRKAYVELSFQRTGNRNAILCRVRNSGDSTFKVPSKDAEQLDAYSQRFRETRCRGPIPEEGRNSWLFEVEFRSK